VEFIRVGSLAEIPEGEVRAFDLPSGKVAVAHVEHQLYAFGDECTHMGCSLAETGSFDDRAAEVECSCHGSVFDVETGEPTNGPAEDALAVFSARIVDGWVEVASQPGREL
jgi:3-phenylpropionate/trans-cinnamate dioxygenase ferredoxin component